MKNKITIQQIKILITAAILYSIFTNISDIVSGFREGFNDVSPLTSIK